MKRSADIDRRTLIDWMHREFALHYRIGEVSLLRQSGDRWFAQKADDRLFYRLMPEGLWVGEPVDPVAATRWLIESCSDFLTIYERVRKELEPEEDDSISA